MGFQYSAVSKGKIDLNVALPAPGKGTSEALQLRIFQIEWVTDDCTLGELQLSSGHACSWP